MMPSQNQVLRDCQRLRAKAFHEAGRSVLAYRFDLYGGTVTIEAGAGAVGFSSSGNEGADAWRDSLCAIVHLAGLAAQRLGQPDAVLDVCDALVDYEHAERLARTRGVRPLADLERAASVLVARDRAAIEAVAAALLEHETLADDEATVVIDAVDEGEEWRSLLATYRMVRDAVCDAG